MVGGRGEKSELRGQNAFSVYIKFSTNRYLPRKPFSEYKDRIRSCEEMECAVVQRMEGPVLKSDHLTKE